MNPHLPCVTPAYLSHSMAMLRTRIHHHLVWLLITPFAASCQGPATPPSVATEAVTPRTISIPLTRILDSLNVHPDSLHFTVNKAERVFQVVAGKAMLKHYPCVLGENPDGDKRMQGDRRTPEGTFGFRSKRMHDKWHAFVWVDYPNTESWRRFKERKRTGEIASTAAIGGEIGIHGVPDGMDHWIVQGVDWTWGCIALRNADLDEIYPHIRPGRTTITIIP